jgi:hypothetical protein
LAAPTPANSRLPSRKKNNVARQDRRAVLAIIARFFPDEDDTMKLQWRLALVLTALGCLIQADLGAGDKKAKDPEKKIPEPAPDIVVKGELINADLKDKIFMQSVCKTYTFKMEKEKSYFIEIASDAFPAHVRLENAEGRQVDADTSRFGAASAFHRPAKTEDYTIVATTQNGGAIGKFTLTVKEVPASDGKPIELKNENGKGAYTGPLLKTDPGFNGAGGKRHKAFLFNMEKGKTYQIDMTSKAFDSYLYLQSPGGQALAQDDDGGGYPSARIIHKAAETGKHRIITTYFGIGAGNFNLTIRQTD